MEVNMDKGKTEIACDITVAWLNALGQSVATCPEVKDILIDKEQILEFYKTMYKSVYSG